jgi:NAD(P)-dependent dehydrogenase (short-subunit alcohol dehydrogenase family)
VPSTILDDNRRRRDGSSTLRRQGGARHRRQQRHRPGGRQGARRRRRSRRHRRPQRGDGRAQRRRAGASARGVVADTARLDELDRAIAATREFGAGRLDVVFANAGVGTFGPLAATSEAMWDSMFDINVKGVYFTVQKAVPLMKPGGAIVLNASVAAGKGNVGSSVYASTKAAVRSFGRTLANELVERGIRVNVVSPGPIETPIFDRTANTEQVAAIKAAMLARNPMKRFGTTDEVTAAVLFLASDAASFITGVDLLVDGGVGSV